MTIPMDDGDTPMHMAGYKARIDVMKELLAHGAKVNAVNNKGETPLYVCIKQDNPVTKEQKLLAIKYLLEQGASIDGSTEVSIIDLASQHLPEAIEYLKSHESISSMEKVELLGNDIMDQ